MTCWYLEPRDPFVVRDGRPNQGRSESTVLRFPYPGTIAGLVRSRLGSDGEGCFQVPRHQLGELKRAEVRGPLLAQPDGKKLFVAAPRDCLLVEPAGNPVEHRPLHPLSSLPEGALIDGGLGMFPVGLDRDEVVVGKPPRNVPMWWPWEALEQWLVDPSGLQIDQVLSLGIPALPTETRVHVKLGDTETAEEGMLFAAAGLRFRVIRVVRVVDVEKDEKETLGLDVKKDEKKTLGLDVKKDEKETLDLALLMEVGDCEIGGKPRSLRPGLAPGGGERRLCRWSQAEGLILPPIPKVVTQHLAKSDEAVTVRVVLLTPAAFHEGWRPSWLLEKRAGVEVKLKAACVPRPETISGWDFEKRWPKKSRRLVSAGSVFWLELRGKPDERVLWAREVWMQNVSDDEQDRRDGFGLAVVGVAS